MLRMKRLWFVAAPAAVAVAVVAALAVWAATRPGFPEDDMGDDKQPPSADLASDLKLMWQTQPLNAEGDPTHRPDARASTDEAIHAASRVFKAVDLVGMTQEEVVRTLGDPRTSNDSAYNFPFWPAPRVGMVYRFDTGCYGWQFNLYFDRHGKVRKVQRLWIH